MNRFIQTLHKCVYRVTKHGVNGQVLILPSRKSPKQFHFRFSESVLSRLAVRRLLYFCSPEVGIVQWLLTAARRHESLPLVAVLTKPLVIVRSVLKLKLLNRYKPLVNLVVKHGRILGGRQRQPGPVSTRPDLPNRVGGLGPVLQLRVITVDVFLAGSLGPMTRLYVSQTAVT